MGRTAEFVAYAAAGDIVRTDFKGKRPSVKSFLSKCEAVLAHHKLHQLWSRASLGAVHRKRRALRDRVHGNRYLPWRGERLQFRGHGIGSQLEGSGRAERMNRGLELYALTGREVVERDPTVADADFVPVEEVESEAKVGDFLVPQARGGCVYQVGVLPSERTDFLKLSKGDAYNRRPILRPVDPNLLLEDREAIVTVQNAIQNWGKLIIVYKPFDADIIILVTTRPSEDLVAVYDAHQWPRGNFLWRSWEVGRPLQATPL